MQTLNDNLHLAHCGFNLACIAVVNCEGVIDSCGNINEEVRFHSAAKPFQSLPFLREDYENPYNLTESERVLLTSSHLGQDIHMAALKSILRKAFINEEQLIVPFSEPLGVLANQKWRMSGSKRSRLFHQCSGNHIGFIIRAKELGADERIYYRHDTPMQRDALKTVERFIKRVDVRITNDNCGIPTFYVRLSEIAAAYMNLTISESFTADLLRRYAVYVEGDGALATELMRKYPVVAKSSTNCIIAIGHIPCKIGISIMAHNWIDLWNASHAVLNAIPIAL